MDYYVKIDAEAYQRRGDVILTGEPVSWQQLFDDEFEKFPYTGFGIHRMDALCKFIEEIGGKKGKFCVFLLKNKDARNQISNMRVVDLANEAGVSVQTANDTLKALRKIGAIKTAVNMLMVNPGIDHKGDRKRESFLTKVYENFRVSNPHKEEDTEPENNS